jgi:CBS domain containing-hemolysin-like protein
MRIFLFVIFLLISTQVLAGFRIRRTSTGEKTAIQHKRELFRSYPHIRREVRGYAYVAIAVAAIGLGCVVAGAMALTGSLTLPGWFVFVVLGLGVTAMTFGGIGIGRRMKGLAIAGMCLGGIELLSVWLALLIGAFTQ